MKPSVGRIVIIKGFLSNGSDEHPAIINCVFGDKPNDNNAWCVNTTMFPDCAPPRPETSIGLFPDRASAEAFQKHAVEELGYGTEPRVAFWPDRV